MTDQEILDAIRAAFPDTTAFTEFLTFSVKQIALRKAEARLSLLPAKRSSQNLTIQQEEQALEQEIAGLKTDIGQMVTV